MSLNSTLGSLATADIELHNFDQNDFMQVMVVYAAPAAVALLCGTLSLYHMRFHLGLLPAYILRDWLGLSPSATAGEAEKVEAMAAGTGPIAANADETFEFYLAWIHPATMSLVLLAPIAIVVMFIAALLILDRMFAVAMSFFFFLGMLLTWTMMRWKFEAWRFSFRVKLLFVFAAMVVAAFELYKTYYAKPYEFIGLGVFCLMVNILFMTRLVYYTRQFKQLVFEKYLGISEPVLRDMKKQEEQTAIRMAAMRKAQAEKELAAAEAKRRQRLGTADSSSAMTDDDGTGSASSTGRRSQNDSNDSDDSPRPSGQQTAGGTSQLASSQHFTDRLSMPTAIWMYLRSLAALAGFAVVIDRAGLGTIGYITAAAIVWMDLVVMCWMYGQRERTPLQACILLCMIRFFMIIFGPTYYLVGHTILFIALSCFFTWQLIDRFLPLSKLRAKTDDEEEIIPQGIAPPTVQRATSVIVESMGNSATREAAARRLQRESRRAAHLATIQSQTSFTQICSLLLLLAAFIFDTVLSYYQDPNTTIPSGLYTRLPQALVGFFGLFVWVVYAMSAWTFRLYVNAHYKSRGWVQFLAATQYVFILGCGWIYYYFNHEKNIPVLCLFLPPIVYFLIGLYSQWVKNDFRVILPKRLRTPPQAHWTEAFWRCGFPANDYFMVWGIAVTAGLIVCLGFGLSYYIDPSWVGAVVAWSLIVLLTSITPVIEYFHTFEYSLNMAVQTFISGVSFYVGLGLIFVKVLDSESGHGAFMLLLVGFLYPILLALIIGTAKWRDDQWVISDHVVWTLFVAGVLLFLLFFAIALVYTPWWIGGGFMFVLAAGLLAMMILPRLKELSPVYYRLTLIVIGVLMFGFIAGSTVNDASGFLGFTVLCGIAFLGLLAGVYYAHASSPLDAISIHKHHIILYSPHIFPIYSFNSMARGKENPLTEVNERVWTIYGVFGVMYLWGVFALFFMSPTTVGLTVSSLALAGAFLFTSELLHRATVLNDELAEAIDYLEEGSPMYYQVLTQAKWIATRNQLLNDTTLFISTKQNRLAMDVGIQTDALTPGSLELTAQQAIITHLEHVYTQQNWETVHEKYLALNRSLPKTSCCGMRREFSVTVEGVVVSRREAFRLCDSLFLDSAAFYRRSQLYQLNLQQELIKAVRGKQYDRWTQIIAMLRDEGNFTITVDYLKTLDPLSEEMQRYEASVDLWVEKRARLLAELARVKAERDADQRRRDTLALLAQEESRKAADLKAIEDLRRKAAEIEAAKNAREEAAQRLEKQQAEELAAFERAQQAALEKEQSEAEQARIAAAKAAEEYSAELARQKRIAEKRRQEKEVAEGLRAAAEAAMAKKEQEELARLRRKAEARRKEIEHARLLAEKKAKLKAEAEIKARMAELEAKHLAEVARVQREQEEENQRRKKQQEDAANAAARQAEIAAREAQHAKEMAQLKQQMEERAEMERREKQRLAASHAAAEAEMAALAAAESAALSRAQAHAAAERERRKEEEEKRAQEEREQEERKEQAEAEARRAVELAKDVEAKKSQRKIDIAEAKKRKMQELEAAKLAAKAAEEERNKKNMLALTTKAQVDSCCTYKLTEQQLVYQEYWSCSTCGDQKMGGGCFCFQCAETCHAGHEIKKAGATPSFCDCGHDRATCLMMKSPSERKAMQAKSKVTPDQAVTEATSDRSMDDSAEHPCIQILKDCQSSGRSWSDPDFPHDDSSIFGTGEVLHPDWVGTKWLRIKDIVKEPTVFLPPIDANDIRQGSLGNCWFMSACAVLTQKPEALMAVFITREYNDQGVYGLRFFKNGKIANVTVDDWLPIQQHGPQHVDALFAKPKDAKAIWVMLIEKAFAKLHKSYQNIEGGWIDDALVDLAGGVADRIRWADEKTKTAIHDGSLWTMLQKYHSSGFLLGCGSPVGASDSEADASPFGIVQSHAYSILSLVAVDGIQLIQVRNPWGRVEWSGDWSDNSPLWTRRMMSKVNFVKKEDGAFWMSFQDFCINFDEVYVARFFPSSLWPSKGQVHGEWRGVTAGGCLNHETVKNNVQYGLTVLEPGKADICIALLLEDVRGQDGKQAGDFPLVILEVYDHQGRPVTQRDRGQQLASSADNLQEIFIECTVQVDASGSKTYTVIPCCFEPGVETSYTLRWHCSRKAKFQQFDQKADQNAVVETRRR